MYTEYFGLRESPFSIAPDPHYLYPSQRDREALAHFQYGLKVSGGFVQLTGEVGTGKTTLIRTLLEQLPDDVDIALILNPVLTVQEFVAAVCDELRITYPKKSNSMKILIDALNKYLLNNHSKGRRTVIIMDEAQNLSTEVLEQLRLLTNLETSKHKLLQIILVGQQELSEKLAARNLRQLSQRITARYYLKGLSHKETIEYITHRCKVAGVERALFTHSAMSKVYHLAKGNPRMINIICDRALLGTYAGQKTIVDKSIVQQAAAEVGNSTVAGNWLKSPIIIGSSVIAAALVMISVWQFWPTQNGDAIAVAQINPPPEVEIEKVDASVSVVPPEQAATTSDVPVTQITEPALPPPAEYKLSSILSDSTKNTGTEAAFTALFSLWQIENVSLKEFTGCEVAEQAGLRCIFKTGTWNNLRNYNRPAVIELLDEHGRRHHLLLSKMDRNIVSLIVNNETYQFKVSEVEKYWYGKYLLLWHPPAFTQMSLRRGSKGQAVIWLRGQLASYQETEMPAESSDLFDDELEASVIAFQRQHQLTSDGVVGQYTLIQLNNYNKNQSPPLLWQAPKLGAG